jgi:ankyrin repeat protein
MERTPLMCALEARDQEMALLLLERGSKHDVKDRQGVTPLHLCARYGLARLLRELLARGAQADCFSSCGSTPLIEAVMHWRLDCALDLLDSSDPNCIDTYGNSALVYACRMGMEEMVRPLVARGAFLVYSYDDKIKSVLNEAIFYNQVDIVQWLVEQGGLVTTKTRCFGRIKRVLLEAGLDRSIHFCRRQALVALV